jgi:D-lactate dehydrogenase (cytochrome)
MQVAAPLAPTLGVEAAAAFGAAFGERFQTGEAIRRQHGSSETHFAEALPDAVVFAQSTEDVAAAVRLCIVHGVPVVAFGAGTSLEGNITPVGGGISLDLSRMNRIVAVNAADFDCTAEAGVRREQLNEYLRDQGLFFPIDPGANATIGGMASTRASGTTAVRYGTMREAVLSLTAVMPDGRIIRTARRARKSAAGYDLTRLLIGAEGTLGIITEVTLRLQPIPETISSAVCPFETFAGAVDTVVEAIQCGVPMARIEFMDAAQMRACNLYSKLDLPEQTTLLFEFHGSPASVAEQVETVRAIASANGAGEFRWATLAEERSTLWKARHVAYYAALAQRPGANGFVTDVTVPLSRLAECIGATRDELDAIAIPSTILGHVGDGNFHVIFALDPGDPAELKVVEAFNERLIARALEMDGTCTGEHGIGLGKQGALVDELGDAVDFMRAIKRALDPDNLFNPGKIFAL